MQLLPWAALSLMRSPTRAHAHGPPLPANAPPPFSLGNPNHRNVVKAFVDKGTRDKIRVLGSGKAMQVRGAPTSSKLLRLHAQRASARQYLGARGGGGNAHAPCAGWGRW